MANKLIEKWDALGEFWDQRGTRVLGGVGFFQGLIGVLIAIPDLFDPENFKYWAAANAVLGYLVYRRGKDNAAVIAAAKASAS